MGCTEPIAIAYAAAIARKVLADENVKLLKVLASGNIIKNVNRDVVRSTQGRKGIAAAAAAGYLVGNADARLEVLAQVTNDQLVMLDEFLRHVPIEIEHIDEGNALDITIVAISEQHQVKVRVAREHSNIVMIEKDGQCLHQGSCAQQETTTSMAAMTMEEIYDFAMSVELEDVQSLLQRQIDYNMAIAKEGLRKAYGASISATLLSIYGNNLQTRAKAMAAAGSDARMSGCELPVIILSGSGNQGMTASIPIVVYAEELNISKPTLYRALLLSDLMTLHQKQEIGRLSAYCGVVCAGAGAGAGIAYLLGCDYERICQAFVNALAITSGMICDGAKPSCAAKIAAAVDAGIMASQMVIRGRCFHSGEGLLCSDIEQTVANVGRLASRGMRNTDEEIIQMMIEN